MCKGNQEYQSPLCLACRQRYQRNDEKLHLVMELRTSIENMRGIIDGANVWCSIITVGGFRYDYIWDILNSEVTDKIAEKVINKWNSV